MPGTFLETTGGVLRTLRIDGAGGGGFQNGLLTRRFFTTNKPHDGVHALNPVGYAVLTTALEPLRRPFKEYSCSAVAKSC